MDNKGKKIKFYHRIKYRNLVDLNISSNSNSELLKTFDINLRKRQTVVQCLNKIVKKAKSKETSIAKATPLYPGLQVPSTSYTNIYEFCLKCPSTSMSRFQEKDIIKRVAARGLENNYPNLLKEIMEEARDEFVKITHAAGITMKVKRPEGRIVLEPYKYLGKTNNYSCFMRMKTELKKKYILHHSLVRNIVNECTISLPYVLFNLKLMKYPMNVEEFQNKLKLVISEIKQNLYEFYLKIVDLVKRDNTFIKYQEATSYLGACTGLLSINISRIIAHTLLHVVNFTGSKKIMPYLILNTTFVDRLLLQPTADEVIHIYENFLKCIIDIPKQFYVLEKYKIKGFEYKTISLCLTEEFFIDCFKKITKNIKEKYEPITKLISNLNEDFSEIYQDIILQSNTTLMQDLNFDEGCRKISYFRSYLNKIAFIPSNIYFLIGQLILTNYRGTLHNKLSIIVENIFKQLTAQHQWENNDICEAFEIIYNRATQTPITTEELTEIGKYMSWVKNEYLDILKERVNASFENLTKLIILGPLSTNHININIETFNWIEKILPVLERNAINFDQLKFEAEENLQKIIEDISDDVKNVYPFLEILNDMDDIENVRDYLHKTTLHMNKILEIEKKIFWINQEEISLSFPKSSYTEFNNLKDFVYTFYHLLTVCLNVNRNLSVWLDGQFDQIKYEETKEKADKFHKELLNIHKNYRSKLRQAQDENLTVRFKGTVDDPDMLNWPAPLKLCSKAIKLIQDFQPSLEVIKIMCNEALMKRHWNEMSIVTGFDITPNTGTTLRKLMKIDFKLNINKYESISIYATKEKELLHNLEEMQIKWIKIKFTMGNHKELLIITQFEDIEAIIEDYTLKLLAMLNLVYVKPYKENVQYFFKKLIKVQDTINELRKIQKQWIQLLPLFSSKSISSEIEESELFNEINKIYTDTLKEISSSLNVEKVTTDTKILENIFICTSLLERVNKGIQIYIDKVCQIFPRFYFLTEQEIIEILSLNNPQFMDKYLRKIFNSIHKFNLNDNLEILGFLNVDNENNYFSTKISTKNKALVEWLCLVEKQITEFLTYNIKESYHDYNKKNYKNWVQKWSFQVLSVISQIYFTCNVENSIVGNKLIDYLDKTSDDIQEIVEILRSDNIQNLEQLVCKSLIVLLINNKDIIKDLIKNKVESIECFEWLSELRYFMEEKCSLKLLDVSFNYGYEYLGNFEQLVITPEIKKSYRILIKAYDYHLQVMCQGNTASGKTEIIKSLSNALGVRCIVFNCCQQLNLKIITNFLKGITSCGAWLCLDEFEKIKIEVTSMLSQHISIISTALKSKLNKFSLHGSEINLLPCIVYFTKKYDSLKEFPNNFKQLFRTISLTQPNYEIITEISLFSYGFKNSKQLSRKIIIAHKYFAELQPLKLNNYNLEIFKQIWTLSAQNLTIYKNYTEEEIVYNSIKVITSSKLSKYKEFFNNILNDLFPNIKEIEKDDKEFLKFAEKSCEYLKIQYNELFLNKIVQLKDMIKLYKSTIIIGDTFSGKTTSMNVLIEALTQMGDRNLEKITLNPKTFTLDQLYGKTKSSKWTDGIIVKYLRKFSVNDKSKKIIIFDSPVDSIWTEDLNSILNSKREICLSSGEILLLAESINIIFEVRNLLKASPAVMSRCGIIFIEANLIGWKPLIKSWISSCKSEWSKEYKEIIITLFDWLVPACLEFINENCQQIYAIHDITAIKNMFIIIKMLLDDVFNTSITNKKEDSKIFTSWIQASALQGIMWGLVATLNFEDKIKFDEFLKLLWKGQIQKYPHPKLIEKIEVGFPQEGLIFDYYYIYKSKGNWKFYQDKLKTEKIIESDYLTENIIPTSDTIKYVSFIKMNIKHNYPVLLIGPSINGKTSIVNHILINKIDASAYEHLLVNLTTKTNANFTQNLILSKLHKQKFGNYGPPKGKTCIIFIDDLNLPYKNDTQSTIELLRQYFDHKIWYDTESTEPIYLNNVNFISAMSLYGMDKNANQSFLRHFNILFTNEILKENITRIYSNILFPKLRKSGFSSDIMTTVNQIITATHQIYKAITFKLKPTLDNGLYRFNLRNFSRIIQNCTFVKKETIDLNKKFFSKFWVHEILREFMDRIANMEDKIFLFNNIKQSLNEVFNEELEILFENILKTENIDLNTISKLLFGTYLNNKNNNKYFEEILEMKQLQDLAIKALYDYNDSHIVKMDVILFEYALEYLSKICRIITMNCSNLLMIGLCGSGRQTLAKLACQIYGQTFFQQEMIKDYDITHWKADIKKFLKEAGALRKPCVFFLNDDNLIDENYLDDIHYLLKTGEIPNLYTLEEEHEILDILRTNIYKENISFNLEYSSIFLYYRKVCRENAHLILSFNPLNSKLRRRFLLYPSIIDCCNVIYFDNWPNEALEQIALTWTRNLTISEEYKNNSLIVFSYFHREIKQLSEDYFKNSGCKIYVTTGSYLHFIKMYCEFIESEQKSISEIKEKYLSALKKLSFASVQMDEMQKSLAEYQPQLREMTIKAAEMTEQIAKETIEVEKASNLVKQDEKIANEQAAAAQILKLDCEIDLAQAIPILEDAISALNTLKPTDITLVKSMKNPPDAIKLVMAAVCVIKDVKPDRIPDPSTGRKTLDYWGPSKRILGDMNFLQTLKDFDKDHIKPEIMIKIRKEYLPHKDFKPYTVAKASSAAEGLCKWIIAIDMYDKVAKEVAPKKEKFEKAEQEYAITMAILKEKKEQVAKIEQKLADLNILLDEATVKQQKLQKNVNSCKRRLSRAQKLISGLSEEKLRWNNTVNFLKNQYNNIPGDILISSGIISYLGPFPKDLRLKAIDSCYKFIKSLNISCSDDYQFQNIFQNNEFEKWKKNGLPNDSFFIDGAIIQKYAKHWPIFIDPQEQAYWWIKNIEEKNSLKIVKFSHFNYINIIEECIILGKPLLIQDFKIEIHPFLHSIISKDIITENNSNFIYLNNKLINYNNNFRLYITTLVRNPEYTPEIYNKTVVINFKLTEEALQEQLLAIVTELEKPSLKKSKHTLYLENLANKFELNSIEDKILDTLLKSEYDILEDEKSLKILEDSKNLFKKIEEKDKECTSLKKSIKDFTVGYKSVSEHSAILYFCVFELPKINHMYQFSLKWFIDLFIESVKKAEQFKVLEKRCKSLINTITHNLYLNITRSIFEVDKLLFSFLLATQILIQRQKIEKEDLLFLMKSPLDFKDLIIQNFAIDWIKQKYWNKICEIDNLSSFTGFLNHLAENSELWKNICKCNNPENKPFPNPWNNNFTKIIIISLIRPDRTTHAIIKFIEIEMGEMYNKPATFNINESFLQSHILSPIIFILTPNTDTEISLKSFAKKTNFIRKLHFISLGNSQSHVNDLFENCQKTGSWICLQNCHLSQYWLNYLENKLENMNYDNTHEDFRLWLTTNPTPAFPVSLLQNSVKIINEIPNDFKNKLIKLYKNSKISDPEFYASCPEKHEIFSHFLYGMAFFHNVIQERNSFGPFGWTNIYEFNETDFNLCVKQVQKTINKNISNNIFKELFYFIGECIYNCYISNPWEIRLINIVLASYLNNILQKEPTNVFNYSKIPFKRDYHDFLKHILQMPKVSNIEFLGIHQNYEMFRNLKESNNILESVSKIYYHGYEENNYLLLNIVEELVNKMPESIDLNQNSFKYTDEDSIINEIIIKEVKQHNKLLNTIKYSLKHLENVLNGIISITSDLEELLDSIKIDKVPKLWNKITYTKSYNLSNFVSNLIKKVEYFRSFYKNKSGIILGNFLQPKAFLTAIKIHYGRKNYTPIETINFQFKIVKDPIEELPKNGVYISELYLIGARWNELSDCLDELLPKTLQCLMPTVWFIPGVKSSLDYEGFYKCPMYKNIMYDEYPLNFILSIFLKSRKSSLHWIKRNVALYCQSCDLDEMLLT